MLAKKTLLGAVAVLAFMSCAHAAEKKQHEPLKIEIDDKTEYTVHYNAFSIKSLPKEMARAYGIKRSSRNAVLNVTVRKGGKGKLMQTQTVLAKVAVQAINLSNQFKTSEMRLVQEGDAIYYIGEFSVTNKETLNFSIKVDPEYQGKEYEITFRQQFFAD
jgi:opacity protein-like surface antigen